MLLPRRYVELRGLALECDHDSDAIFEATGGNLDRLYRLQCCNRWLSFRENDTLHLLQLLRRPGLFEVDYNLGPSFDFGERV